MTDYFGGRKWENSNDLTGVTGLLNLNSAEKQGIVSSNDALLLFIEVSAISYIDDAGALQSFPGTGSPVSVPGNEATVFIWIDDSNLLQQSISSFPAIGNFFIALAIVTTSVTNVLQIINMQQASATVAPGGVNSIAVTSPVLNTGTATDPIIDMQPATAGQDGHATAPQITKLDAIEALADVTDSLNVAAANAVMDDDILANGNLLTKIAGVVANIVPGAIGTVLTSLGVGNTPAYQAITAFPPEVLIANSVAGIASGSPLSYPAAGWDLLFKTGAINIDGTDKELINLVTAGTYVAVCIMQGDGNNRAHVLQFNSPPQTSKVKRGKAFTNLGPAGTTQDSLTVLGAMQGPGQVALETSGTNFGTNGVLAADAMQNFLIMWRIF